MAIAQTQVQAPVAPASRQDRPQVPIGQRPSPTVEATAVHMLLSGWASYVQINAELTEAYVLSHARPGAWYRLLADHIDGHMVCDCWAGVQCWHMAAFQILTGLCAIWPPREPQAQPVTAVPPTGQNPRLAAVVERAGLN